MKITLLIVLFSLNLLSNSLAQAADKTIGILVFDGVLTSDITAPAEVFGVATKQSWFSDYNVKFINVVDQPSITTEEGLTIIVSGSIYDRHSLNTLIVPSSYNMAPLLDNKKLIEFIQTQEKHVDWLASNCSGSELLAKAGLLNGKNATTWAGGEADLQKKFPAVKVQTDINYVIDGNIVTSNGSVVSYVAALKLLSLMAGEKSSDEVFQALQMNRLTSKY